MGWDARYERDSGNPGVAHDKCAGSLRFLYCYRPFPNQQDPLRETAYAIQLVFGSKSVLVLLSQKRANTHLHTHSHTHTHIHTSSTMLTRRTKAGKQAMCSYITHLRKCCACAKEETILISEKPCAATNKSVFGSCGRGIKSSDKSSTSLHHCCRCRDEIDRAVYVQSLRVNWI
ncbi:hypothetical protein F4777DRAFT_89894 [Nemania sp. FL0916]|nr:hypothetical protein F4777DRAFT_89894 [Nemania sp. FL0916]